MFWTYICILEIIGFPIFSGLDAVKSIHAGVATIGLVGAGRLYRYIFLRMYNIERYFKVIMGAFESLFKTQSFTYYERRVALGLRSSIVLSLNSSDDISSLLSIMVYCIAWIFVIHLFFKIIKFWCSVWARLNTILFVRVSSVRFSKLVALVFVCHRMLQPVFLVHFIIQWNSESIFRGFIYFFSLFYVVVYNLLWRLNLLSLFFSPFFCFLFVIVGLLVYTLVYRIGPPLLGFEFFHKLAVHAILVARANIFSIDVTAKSTLGDLVYISWDLVEFFVFYEVVFTSFLLILIYSLLFLGVSLKFWFGWAFWIFALISLYFQNKLLDYEFKDVPPSKLWKLFKRLFWICVVICIIYFFSSTVSDSSILGFPLLYRILFGKHPDPSLLEKVRKHAFDEGVRYANEKSNEQKTIRSFVTEHGESVLTEAKKEKVQPEHILEIKTTIKWSNNHWLLGHFYNKRFSLLQRFSNGLITKAGVEHHYGTKRFMRLLAYGQTAIVVIPTVTLGLYWTYYAVLGEASYIFDYAPRPVDEFLTNHSYQYRIYRNLPPTERDIQDFVKKMTEEDRRKWIKSSEETPQNK